MPRAIPILVIIGAAIYSFFDVLQTEDERLRRFSKMVWLILALIPVIGAILWFTLGRPARPRGGYGPPRVITLPGRSGPNRPTAPDDDVAFLRKLDEEAWKAKRAKARETKPETPGDPTRPTPTEGPAGTVDGGTGETDGPRRPNEGPTPSGGVAPAS